jgi:ribosomal protein S1
LWWGGRHSSNTTKLAEICSAHTRTLRIETADELRAMGLKPPKGLVGITAGTSTPPSIIKEVQETMSEILSNQEELSFEEMLEQSFKSVRNGEKVTGVVTTLSPTEVGVDIGTKHAGYIPLSELTDDPTASIEDLVKKGDELELMVVRVNDVEGTVMLSKKRLDAAAGFERVMNAVDTQEVLEGVVTEVIKGGLLVLTHGVKVFVPASHATLSRTDDLSPMLRTKVSFKILEVNRQRRRAVGSIKTVLREERKEKERQFWDTVEVGQKFTGTVKSLTDYGAFIDLGGVDGMVHVSELSWAKIRHPSQVVQVGQEVDVYVRDLDHEKRKISLGYKRDEDNPWNILERDYAVGQDHDVKVVSLTTFGAFAELIPGIDGLIHISQLATHRVGKPSDAVSVGDVVRVRITELDFERKRVSLSIRAVQEDAQATEDAQALADYNATQTEAPDEEAAPAEETPADEA